jgi:transmembrane sensor
MTDETSHDLSDELKDEALAWLVRVQSDRASADDWAALTAWLEGKPAHLAAFEWAEALDTDVTRLAPDLFGNRAPPSAEIIPFGQAASRARSSRARSRQTGSIRSGYGQPSPASRWSRIAAACAAIALVAFAGALVGTPRRADYATGADQTRLVHLSDGTAITLNANSRIETRLGLLSRDVRLLTGEASFDVAHDTARPFHVDVAQRRVTVVGTEFNINRIGDATVVTVRRGVVRLSPKGGGDGRPSATLAKGDQAEFDNTASSIVARHVSADDAFAWHEGRLVCIDLPLSRIVAYANRGYRQPITLSSAVGQRRFSGVLIIKDEAKLVHTLAMYLSLSEVHANGRYMLR